MSSLALYLLAINALTLAFMALDKALAKKGSWRVPEASLLALTLAGGSLSMLVAMQLFRHKRRKAAFVWRVYGIMVLQALLLLWRLINNGA